MILTLEFLTIQTKEPLMIPMKDIRGEVITRKNKVSFDYLNKTYNLLLNDPMLAMHAIQFSKEN